MFGPSPWGFPFDCIDPDIDKAAEKSLQEDCDKGQGLSGCWG